MTKTLVLNDEQQKALRFCLGGRHRLQTDPPVLERLGEIEAQLNASTEESPQVATERLGTVSLVAAGQQGDQLAALSAAPKRRRGRK